MAETERRTTTESVARRFLTSEAAGGLVLMAAALAAMLVANSGLEAPYRHLLETEIGPMTVHRWINDGLMAAFFLLVGLEIKREFVGGRLSSPQARALPLAAAVSGMIVPALLYLAIAGGEASLARGWAIPAATDIAFAVGVLALLGKRAPASLKLLLVTVAIADDLGAVAIIAFAYTAALDLTALAAAAALLLVMVAMGKAGVTRLTPYLIAAAALWYAMLLSGVHATVAGVLAAAAIPIAGKPGTQEAEGSPLHRLEHALSPWVAFLVVPVFGFANAGVPLAGIGADTLLAPLPLAIAAGLFVGKQIGIFGAVRIMVGLGLAERPQGATWLQVYGVSLLCGIGFTMSLFIGALAFAGDPALTEQAKFGVLLGSLLSAAAGFALLRFGGERAPRPPVEKRAGREA